MSPVARRELHSRAKRSRTFNFGREAPLLEWTLDTNTLWGHRKLETDEARMTTDDYLCGEEIIRISLTAGAPRRHRKRVHRAIRTWGADTLSRVGGITCTVQIVALARLGITPHAVRVNAVVR